MTIEATLERIAAATEAILKLMVEGAETPDGPVSADDTPAEQDTKPRKRGRPRKTAEPEQAAPAAPSKDVEPETPPKDVEPETSLPEADEPEEQGGLDFLDDAATPAAVAKEYTIEEVRKALGELQTRVGTTRALALFKEVSGGAERLPQLAPEKFAAVFEAAEKMRK